MRFLAVLVAFVSVSAFADVASDAAVAVFDASLTKDQALKDQVAEMKKSGATLAGKTGATALNYSCGVAGCTTGFLVTRLYKRPGVNAQGAAVGAYVSVMGTNAFIVRVLDGKDMQAITTK